MRLLLFIAAVIALPFILWKCSANNNGIFKNAIEKTTKNKTKKKSEKVIHSDTIQQSPIVTEVIPEENETRIYNFKMRQVPDTNSLANLNEFCKYMVDPSTQTVSITGPRDSVLSSIDFFRSIDLPTKTCSVSCWVIFVDNRKNKGFDFTSTFSDLLNLSSPRNLTASIGTGSLIFSTSSDNIQATLGLVADGATVEVIQRPQIMLSNGISATIESLSEVPLPNSTLSNGIAQSSIQYRKVGLSLNVTPTFLGDDRIRLNVTQNNGLIGSSVEINGATVPVIESQSVQSTLEMQLGQSVLLGGVETTRKRNAVGLLKHNKETINGLLYVVIATHPNFPKAYPVQDNSHKLIPPGYALPEHTNTIWELLLPEKK